MHFPIKITYNSQKCLTKSTCPTANFTYLELSNSGICQTLDHKINLWEKYFRHGWSKSLIDSLLRFNLFHSFLYFLPDCCVLFLGNMWCLSISNVRISLAKPLWTYICHIVYDVFLFFLSLLIEAVWVWYWSFFSKDIFTTVLYDTLWLRQNGCHFSDDIFKCSHGSYVHL